jgi:predicted TIM-barrel fold metal-dependent hydrolase
MLSGTAAAARLEPARAQQPAGEPQETPDKLLLKDYRPKSIFKIPKTDVRRAKFPIVDVHCHGFRQPAQLDEAVKLMDAVNVEKTVVFTGASTPERFAEAARPYAKYAGRFELWCGFDLTGADQAGFGPNAVGALEECHRLGAFGVGEISDKGRGFGVRGGNRGGSTGAPATGPHPDDPRMDALFDRCAKLGMPVNIHVSDPIWAYEPMDRHNDGLMNAYTWRIDVKPGVLGHNELIESLERMAKKHAKTTFIACHLANLEYDLTRLGEIFDRNPNLYADISARFAETAAIPRAVSRFLQRYPGRVLYGTDMRYDQRIFSSTFRILETLDEHFYENDSFFNFDYHWPLHGFGLPDAVLKKVYGDNARSVLRRARNNAG